MDEFQGQVPQPLHAEGSDHTFVGRVRQDPTCPNTLSLWVVADNLRKGAASNAVQCAEELLKRGIVK
jgi:aspartate-semialdehyde dehydrogenase